LNNIKKVLNDWITLKGLILSCVTFTTILFKKYKCDKHLYINANEFKERDVGFEILNLFISLSWFIFSTSYWVLGTVIVGFENGLNHSKYKEQCQRHLIWIIITIKVINIWRIHHQESNSINNEQNKKFVSVSYTSPQNCFGKGFYF